MTGLVEVFGERSRGLHLELGSGANDAHRLTTQGGGAHLRRLQHRELRSAWSTSFDPRSLLRLAARVGAQPQLASLDLELPPDIDGDRWEASLRRARLPDGVSVGARLERSSRAVAWSDRPAQSFLVETQTLYLRALRADGSIFTRALSVSGPDDPRILEWIEATLAAWSDDPAHPGGISGTLPVVFAAGGGMVVVHELLGHPLEADNVLRKLSPLAGVPADPPVSHSALTVVDTGEPAAGPGAIVIDDEGTPACPAVLVESGRVVGVLCDRATARALGRDPSGNARRQSYRHDAAPRLRNLTVGSGPHAAEGLVSGTQHGLWVERLGECAVDPGGRFTLWVEAARRIRRGRLAERLRGVRVEGQVLPMLARLVGVGDDVRTFDEPVFCEKHGTVATGLRGPSLLFEGVEVW